MVDIAVLYKDLADDLDKLNPGFKRAIYNLG